MNEVYFVVKVTFDQNGQPVKGTEQYVSVLTDIDVIYKAEEANQMHRARGRVTDKDIIKDGARRVKTTISEFPAVRVPGFGS